MNINSHPFREKKIDILSKNKLDNIITYKEIEVSKNNVLCQEALVNIFDYGLKGFPFYNSNNNPPYYKKIEGSTSSLLLRKSVAKKIMNANKKLRHYGVEFFIYDCYRPEKVQSFLYLDWFPRQLRENNPDLKENELNRLLNKLTAAPNTKLNGGESPPPHSTGGAVDLSLRYIENKQQLFMGSIIDDSSELAITSFYEILQYEKKLGESEMEALKNRRVLYWALKEEGFENYPNEWWHFSFGDQLWAYLSNNKIAYYSKVDNIL